MSTLIATLALAHHALFVSFCVVALVLLVDMAVDAVSNLKNKQL